MTILCERCGIPMTKIQEEELTVQTPPGSGSASRGRMGVSGLKWVSSSVESGGSSKGQVEYECEKCHRIKKVTE